MNKYKVFFEFNGKKQAMIISAKDKYDARYYVMDKINIHKVQLIKGTEPDDFEDEKSLNIFKDFFK